MHTDGNGVSQSCILVVDDDPDTCQMLATIFSHQHLAVEIAMDGHEGLEKVRAHAPDLIVLDVMMPNLDGWDTFTRLKEFSDVPVMFLSAKSDHASVARGFEMGACDFVTKPFITQDLLRRVASFLPDSSHEHGDLPLAKALPDHASSGWLAFARRQLYFAFKRAADLLVSALALVGSTPLMALIAALIKLDSPGPVIYRQERVGSKRIVRHGHEHWVTTRFCLYKFRSMYQQADAGVHQAFVQAFIHNDHKRMAAIQNGDTGLKKLMDDPRVTPIGKLLRKLSLDELPQLWNVLRGEMSLVGPRPAIPYEVNMYQPWHVGRLEAKPGITGLWQVTARSSAEFEEMIRLDLDYIERQSILIDVWILLKTPIELIWMKGAV